MNFIIKVILPCSWWCSSWICTRRYFPIRFWIKRQNKKLSNWHEECFIFCWAKVPSIMQNYSSELIGCWIEKMTKFKQEDIFILYNLSYKSWYDNFLQLVKHNLLKVICNQVESLFIRYRMNITSWINFHSLLLKLFLNVSIISQDVPYDFVRNIAVT